jgi:N-acetyl-anhydromuramyl-L-alanine amidase AmpD
MANVLRYKGHFLIDHTGKIWQFIPIAEVAWHTGSAKRKALGKSEPPTWWKERWQNLKSPLDLPPWKGGGPNGNSIGIDLLAHGNGAISKGYTKLQYQSLAKLIKDLTASTDVPISREHILGHEDVDPIARGTSKGGWDPGKFDWDKLFDAIKPVHKIPEIPIKKPLKVWSLIRKVLFGR